MGVANVGGTGDSKSVTKKKSEEDTEVSAYEREIAKEIAQKDFFEKTSKENLNPNNNIQKKKKIPFSPPTDNDGKNNNTPTVKVASIPKVDTAPTESEVSQSAAADADADADDIYIRKKKSKARGRSMMTLTTPQGVKDDKLTLGKPSLLGSVV